MSARALELSESPERESVLILAHGMGAEAENAHLLEAMQEVAEGVEAMGFHAVQTATLREDWPEERAIAEERIQSFVRAESAAGRRVLVVPFRLWGFGPYAEVLEGLEYTPGQGLLPHAEITTWIRNTASGLMR